jgi:hypothetical protein
VTYEEVAKGVVKRRQARAVGLFIDGTGLDRATRRLNRRVDLSALVRGVTSGLTPVVARYYTLIPYEDDSRQRAFLDAVARAGLSVIVKRLPPKGVNRQVGVDVEMGADMIAFALGHARFSSLSQYHGADIPDTGTTTSAVMPLTKHRNRPIAGELATPAETPEAGGAPTEGEVSRIVTVVCPSRDLSYPLAMIKEFGVDTVSADFGQFNAGDLLKSAAKWIDLSDSETIWRE